MGIAYQDLGDYRRAIDYQQQRLEIAREIGDRRGKGTALGNLGSAYCALGEFRRAIEYLKQRVAIAREIRDRLGEANALYNTSVMLDRLGDRDEARRLAQESLTVFESIGSPNAAQVLAVLAKWTNGDD